MKNRRKIPAARQRAGGRKIAASMKRLSLRTVTETYGPFGPDPVRVLAIDEKDQPYLVRPSAVKALTLAQAVRQYCAIENSPHGSCPEPQEMRRFFRKVAAKL